MQLLPPFDARTRMIRRITGQLAHFEPCRIHMMIPHDISHPAKHLSPRCTLFGLLPLLDSFTGDRPNTTITRLDVLE